MIFNIKEKRDVSKSKQIIKQIKGYHRRSKKEITAKGPVLYVRDDAKFINKQSTGN